MNSSSRYPHEVGMLNTVAFINSTIFIRGLVLVQKQREQRTLLEAFAPLFQRQRAMVGSCWEGCTGVNLLVNPCFMRLGMARICREIKGKQILLQGHRKLL